MEEKVGIIGWLQTGTDIMRMNETACKVGICLKGIL